MRSIIGRTANRFAIARAVLERRIVVSSGARLPNSESPQRAAESSRVSDSPQRLEEGLQMVALNHFVSSCPRGDAPGSSRETDQSVFSVLTNPQTDLVFAAKLSATRQSPLVQPARFARLTDYA